MPTNLRDLQILYGKKGALVLQLFKTKPAIVVIGVVGLEMINKIKERPLYGPTFQANDSLPFWESQAAMDDIVICPLGCGINRFPLLGER